MITIVDYGIGNLRSIEKAFQAIGASVVRTDDPSVIGAATHVVLPGVGAFGACAGELRRRGLARPVIEYANTGRPFLGVCVGMQLLFDVGEEMGRHQGLGLLPGRVVRLDGRIAGKALKVPHVGWNTIEVARPSTLLDGLDSGAYLYFVHSFQAVAETSGDILATTEYGARFPSVVGRNNVFGVQFHPEKSQRNGLKILSNFAAMR